MLKKTLMMVALAALSYNAYASGDAEAGKAKAAVCAACHGSNGVSVIPMNPNLAGQVPGYIAAQLKAFKSGERVSPIMQGQVQPLSETDMADLDAYYSSLPGTTTSTLSKEDEKLYEEGEKLYRGGFADRGISSCVSCHGPSGHGIPKNIPRVSAQHKEYIEQQLLAYKKGQREGYNNIMADIAFGLSELQIKQLSVYMAGLK